MTREEESRENHRKHKEVWDWCGETGKDKSEHPMWENEMAFFYCFACEEAISRVGVDFPFFTFDARCEYCPIKWRGGGMCDGKMGEFDLWCEAKTIKERKYWAKKIANKRWSNPKGGTK